MIHGQSRRSSMLYSTNRSHELVRELPEHWVDSREMNGWSRGFGMPSHSTTVELSGGLQLMLSSTWESHIRRLPSGFQRCPDMPECEGSRPAAHVAGDAHRAGVSEQPRRP